MVKKKQVTLDSIDVIDQRIQELKLELAKYKGMLVSKTKVNNTSKKGIMKKEIARLLTKKNQLREKDIIKTLEGRK